MLSLGASSAAARDRRSKSAHTTSRRYILRRLQLLTRTLDYTLNNPDTLTKYKTAGQISEKVLAEVAKLCVPGAKIVEICQKGDKLIEEEVAKVYRGKKITKGMSSTGLTRSRTGSLTVHQVSPTPPPSRLLPMSPPTLP